MDLMLIFSSFACIALIFLSVFWFLFKPQTATTEKLKTVVQGPNVTILEDMGHVGQFVEKIAEPLNNILPPSASEASKLQKQLMYAGYRSHNAPIIYRAIQLISLLTFPLIAVLVSLYYAKPADEAIIPILSSFVSGFFLPRKYLKRLIKNRQQKIRWGLADALDLMVVSVEAGLGLNAAMAKVSKELKEVHPEICVEFELCNTEIRVGRNREEALRNLAERTGVEDLRSLVAMLIQADKFGTSIAKAVRVYSDSLRVKRRQRAEQAAQKAAVKLLFPLACFLFPTLFLALLGPAVINLKDVFVDINQE
jgi:tight adherence protein C